MGYRLLTQADTSSLPHSGSALGMDIERAGHISDDGLSFDIIRVKQVRRGSPGAQAGFRVGDQIIAVDSRVFATLTAFAAYVESVESGREIRVDYIPAGGGPQQAQRLVVTVGAAGWPVPPGTGLSTGTTIAIGVGAAALFGCYELGCFSHRTIPSKIADKKQSRPVPPGMQPQ
jgi:hypothetical protein